MFNIDGTQCHDILLVDTTIPYRELLWAIQDKLKVSKNCEEIMSRYRTAGSQDIEGMKVQWASAGRDSKNWPSSTIVTDDNLDAVLRMMELGHGKDVMEVHLREPGARQSFVSKAWL